MIQDEMSVTKVKEGGEDGGSGDFKRVRSLRDRRVEFDSLFRAADGRAVGGCASFCASKHNPAADAPMPQFLEETIEVVKMVSQERIDERRVDVLVPQIFQ